MMRGEPNSKEFIEKYWQKSPKLIRHAIDSSEWESFNGGDLAGISCASENSRLVVGEGQSWNLTEGPIEESRFRDLPIKNWTLLVCGMEQWEKSFRALQDRFRFIPDWRMDDVMVSYAVDGGSVGPHVDQYDVFLIQIKGKRRWKIESNPRNLSESDFIPNSELQTLKEFNAEEEWILSPGDLLYLPPGVPHYGTAVGDECMTVSIGFRAPAYSQIFTSVGLGCPKSYQSKRYEDPNLPKRRHPSQILDSEIEKVIEIIDSKMVTKEEIAVSFGRLVTAPSIEQHYLRLAYTLFQGQVLVFANGLDSVFPLSELTWLESFFDRLRLDPELSAREKSDAPDFAKDFLAKLDYILAT